MSEGIAVMKRSAVAIDLKQMDYGRALTLQVTTVQSKIRDRSIEDHLFFVEHPKVFTLGKRGGRENLTVSEKFLADRSINIFQTDRGGNITYHGPGQAVLYPVIDLEKCRIGVKDFVFGLEEVMRQTAADFGVSAKRDSRNHGLWIQNAKIGSVGISIKKGVSFHGLAMNIFTDLTPFSWINPCGLTDVGMTSIAKELPAGHQAPDMSRVRDLFLSHFSNIFDYTINMGTSQ